MGFQQGQQIGSPLLDDHSFWYVHDPLVGADLRCGPRSRASLECSVRSGWLKTLKFSSRSTKKGSHSVSSSSSSEHIGSSLAWMRSVTCWAISSTA
ncbi:hypothetical protein SO802_015555 [Lithocarpus litseifolius]|uniref:Uncharacterized protein n=1 Tax=Lithocarpus litseifolius TaxID=425828 RepID=A0AAW2CVA8_9ROSI